VTDHRVSVTVTGVERVLSGESLSDILEALMEFDKKERLENFLEQIEKGGKQDLK
jgi:protein subunit release factor A